MKFSWENFHGALRLKHLHNAIIQSLYNINKYSRKNCRVTLENRVSLNQQIFPRLWYTKALIVMVLYIVNSLQLLSMIVILPLSLIA